jgi:Predicted membrane protein
LGAAHFICPFTVWDIILWVLFLAIQMTTMFNDTGYESDKLYINLIALLLPVIVGAFICAAIVFRAGLSIQQEQWWYALLSAKAGAPVFGNLGLESAILVPFLLALSALIFALKNDYLEDSDYFVPAGLAMLCVVFFRFVILGAYASRSIAFLPYLPILNLVDILQITALSLSFIYLKQQFEPQGGPAQIAVYFFSFLFFLLLNLIIGRLVHHWGKVGFNIRDLWASDSFQASCAVFWAICGIAAMIRGHKTANRLLWLFGATLMAADLAKIFFVDLSRADALARIISFVAVGLVLILVGYFAPIPPGKYETAEEIR